MNETENSYEQTYTITSIAVGLIQLISTAPGLICNSIIAYAMVHNGLLNSSSPVIYRLVFNLLASDTCQLCLAALYLAPSVAFQSWLLPEWAIRIPSTIFLANWYEMNMMLDVIALHRCLSMISPSTCSNVLTHRAVNMVILVSWFCAAVFVSATQYWLPCCRFLIYHVVYSYAYLEPGFNYADYLVELPVNILTTIILIVCYVIVIYKIHKHRREVHIGDAREVERKAQEIRLSIQFVLISAAFIFCWVFFRVFPLLVPPGVLLPFALISILGITNNSINSFLYLRYNDKIKESVKIVMEKDNTQIFYLKKPTEVANKTQSLHRRASAVYAGQD